MFDGTHPMLGLHGFGWILWLLLFLGGAWLIAQMSGRADATSTDPAPTDPTANASPLEVLKRKYAREDLSTEEYEERKRRLERDTVS